MRRELCAWLYHSTVTFHSIIPVHPPPMFTSCSLMELNVVNSGSRPRTPCGNGTSAIRRRPCLPGIYGACALARRAHARLKRPEQLVAACLCSIFICRFSPPSSPFNHSYWGLSHYSSICTDVIAGLALGPQIGGPRSGLHPQNRDRRPGSRDNTPPRI